MTNDEFWQIVAPAVAFPRCPCSRAVIGCRGQWLFHTSGVYCCFVHDGVVLCHIDRVDATVNEKVT